MARSRGAGLSERVAKLDGIELAYETFGDPADPVMLLVMGLGVQMLGWDERFCGQLAGLGFHVVRFDNRDVGHSTKLEDAGAPNLMAALAGDTGSASYTLDDMAGDAVGLLDHLGAEAAHVVGASMGGMIGQVLAARHPDRVLSLTSIMASTGNPAVGAPLESVLPVLLTPAPAERDAFVDHVVATYRMIGSPGYPADEERLRSLARASYDRSYHPAGVARQLLAILAAGDRTGALRSIRVPTVVIHGEDDPLIDVSGGEATARAIPDAKLIRIEGMGHDLPEQLWPRFVEAIVENAARASERV